MAADAAGRERARAAPGAPGRGAGQFPGVRPGPGPAGLAGLEPGAAVSGFTAMAVYVNSSDEPVGARFAHAGGMTVDVVFFASVPQVSLYARTLPVSDRGEQHTGEHLLIGKGRAGKYLNSLMEMRLGEHTAGVYPDHTYYQFNTAAGAAGFYELLEAYLRALVLPDFTDEEARREVAHLGVARDGGVPRLEEKGTIYAEMVASMEKPGSVNWDQLKRMLYGPAHPLGRSQGGLPDAIREMTPDDVRRFHAANYHLSENMAMVAALPLAWSAGEFLSRLDGIIRAIEPAPPAIRYAAMPAFEPLAGPEVRVGAFPSETADNPQAALFAWRPLASAGAELMARGRLLMALLAGDETSYLHRDLVDSASRKLDSGATAVSAGVTDMPGAFPIIEVEGLPAASLGPELLGRLRGAVQERISWLAGLRPGSPELAEASAKARSLLAASRRAALKFMDDPPDFGMRHGGDAWHRHLDLLAAEGGFKKRLALDDVYGRLEAGLDSGRNPWAADAAALGLLGALYVSAVKPDPGLLARQRAEREARLKQALGLLRERFGAADDRAALEAFELEIASRTAELEALDRGLPRPSFVKDPPLALDDADYVAEALPWGRSLVRAHFGSTPFTGIELSFDLSRIADHDYELVPALAAALAETGVVTKGGEALDYVRAAERVRSEIHGLSAGISRDAASGRVELTLAAHASTAVEVEKAVGWLEDYLLRSPLRDKAAAAAKPAGSAASLREAARSRLADVLRRQVKAGQNLLQGREEDWADEVAQAYVYQDRPLWLAAASPFTALRHSSRLRWRLEEPSPAALKVYLSTLTAVEELAAAVSSSTLGRGMAALDGELGDMLRFELAHLPPGTWREDLLRVARDLAFDLGRPASELRDRLSAVLGEVLVRDGARVAIVGREANTGAARKLVLDLLAKLPERGAYAAVPRSRQVVLERLKDRLPGLARLPVHAGFVNNGAKTGVHVESAAGPGYLSGSAGAALDALAMGVFAGAGPHGFFMRTWSAGLAYSNGIRPGFSSGRLWYYAERCPDLAATMRFVSSAAAGEPLADPGLVEYSLANAFSDFRGARDFWTRGTALAADIADGRTPEAVRAFKTRILEAAASPGALEAVRGRMPAAVGRVLSGYGVKVSDSPGAAAVVIGPEDQLARYEAYLRELGEADSLVRLYPRDFWP